MERISDGKIRSRTKLSSAGLIFFYYGEAVIRDHLGMEKEKDMSKTKWIKRLYNHLINEIDFIDFHIPYPIQLPDYQDRLHSKNLPPQPKMGPRGCGL